MSGKGKVVLGILTVWPIVYSVSFIIFVFSQIIMSFSGSGFSKGGPAGPPAVFFVLFILHFLTMLLTFALIIIYIRDVFRNERVPKEKRVLWTVVLLLGHVAAMPIYWYIYIWPGQEADGGKGI